MVSIYCYSSIVNVKVKRLSITTGHSDFQILFRKYVSKNASGKGRAVLEGVGLDVSTINACYGRQPEEEAVQSGLHKWHEGQGRQPPTWTVLLHAMKLAEIHQRHSNALKLALVGGYT